MQRKNDARIIHDYITATSHNVQINREALCSCNSPLPRHSNKLLTVPCGRSVVVVDEIALSARLVDSDLPTLCRHSSGQTEQRRERRGLEP